MIRGATKLICVLTLLISARLMAQSVDIHKIEGDSDSDTTIQIHKGRPATAPSMVPSATPLKWEIHDGTADVDGEASATAKEAKAAWKKACAEWKKEFREDNKENKVLSINCGTSDCSGEAGSKVCSSKATYKIKTRVDN